MIEIQIARTEYTTLKLTDDEAKEVTSKYLEMQIMKGKYINSKGVLEDWTSFPYGSGTTTQYGRPSKIQIAAYRLLMSKELKK